MDKAPPSPPRPLPPARHRCMDGSTMDPDLNVVSTTPAAIRKGDSEELFPYPNKGRRDCPYYFRRCKTSLTSIESLPDELLFDILVHLPAEDIYYNAMHVCRRWSHIIRAHDFVQAHLVRHSTPGLLVQYYDAYYRTKTRFDFVELRQGRIEVSNFNFWARDYSVLSSCNGLIMEYYTLEERVRINNPAIRRQLVSPPLIRRGRVAVPPSCSIAYSAASMEYKVVCVRMYVDDGYELRCTYTCAISTVGVDKSWRDVCIPKLSPEAKYHLFNRKPITTEGFLHWIDEWIPNHVLTLNVETETFAQYPFPQVHNHDRVSGHKYYYLSTGKSLSFFFSYSCFSMDVWEMKSETGEWTKMCNIDLEPQKFEFEQFRIKDGRLSDPFFLKPVGWLAYREVVVLRLSHDPSRVCFAYNVLTRDFNSFELDDDAYYREFHLHTNNLVGLI